MRRKAAKEGSPLRCDPLTSNRTMRGPIPEFSSLELLQAAPPFEREAKRPAPSWRGPGGDQFSDGTGLEPPKAPTTYPAPLGPERPL